MKKTLIILLAVAMLMVFPARASAAETTEASVPVTLTVINTVHPISVTVPAALPVSVVDGYIVTASNAAITNHGSSGAIQVTNVDVQAGTFQIGDYNNFSEDNKTIALCINDCPTEKAGPLAITEESFPVIGAGEALAIQYQAKVSVDHAATDVNAATVIFTIASAEPVADTEMEGR